jgi:predicted Fe-Mo cluster-binding NifX family protein
MKIAVPVSKDNKIESHIGDTESYFVFTISDNKEIEGISAVKSPGGCGCNSDIASTLASDGVSVVLAAGIGGGSTKAFNKSGISVIRGCEGDATESVKMYLKGSLIDKGSSCGNHQPHHHHKDQHSIHRSPEIVSIHESSHQCGCGHGSGNSCSHN